MRRYGAAVCAALLLFTAAAMHVSAQVRYARGQDVAPAFEGWEHNPDGTYSMVFGYLNRNYEEEVDIPIGPDNNIAFGSEPGGDRGQPTHFYPRRQRFLFKVVVPKDWDQAKRVVWTVTSHGRTNQAQAWLQPEWELSVGVIAENSGGGVPDLDNKPPTVTISPVPATTLPDTMTLTATATDDGLPKPYRRISGANLDRDGEPARPRGVQVKWIQYRGPGKVRFEPEASAIVHGEPVTLTSKLTFSAPGTYVLRAIAFDGQLSTARDVTVTVNAGPR